MLWKKEYLSEMEHFLDNYAHILSPEQLQNLVDELEKD